MNNRLTQIIFFSKGLLLLCVVNRLQIYKSGWALFMMVTYLLSATACREWLKLPALISHFTTYVSVSDRGWVSFLHDHYLHEQDKGQDEQEDQNLPFHSSEYANTLQFVSLEPSAEPMIPMVSFPFCSNQTGTGSNHLIPSGFHSGIWQPPRA